MALSQEQTQNYLLWLSERGIRWPNLVRSTPAQSVSSDHKPLKSKDVCAVICHASGPEYDLLLRMLNAIHLNPSEIKSQGSDQSPIQLFFAPPPKHTPLGTPIKNAAGGIDFFTYHPADLLTVPELKPIAWRHLQVFAALIQRELIT